jgi:hypothetical protein
MEIRFVKENELLPPPYHFWQESMQGESCRLVGVGCVVVRVASCLYRGAFWRCICRLGLFFNETDTPPKVYS